jgi:hypothetical protein
MLNVALDDRDLDRTRAAIDAAFGDKWLRVKPAHEACARVILTLYACLAPHGCSPWMILPALARTDAPGSLPETWLCRMRKRTTKTHTLDSNTRGVGFVLPADRPRGQHVLQTAHHLLRLRDRVYPTAL